MPLLITKEQAQAVLEPYHPVFFEVVEAAWVAWCRDHAPKFAGPRRALQVCMNELMEQDFRMRLGARTDEIRMPPPHPASNRFWLEFLQRGVLVFMKKFKNAHQISNYPTNAAEDFNGQRVLAGIPSLPRITLGYFVTKTADELAGTHVAFLLGKKAQWSYELRRDPGPGGRIFVPQDQPTLPIAPAEITLKADRDRTKDNG